MVTQQSLLPTCTSKHSTTVHFLDLWKSIKVFRLTSAGALHSEALLSPSAARVEEDVPGTGLVLHRPGLAALRPALPPVPGGRAPELGFTCGLNGGEEGAKVT